MNEWFFVSAWYENKNSEVHFEIANEDGEQFFFYLPSELINGRLANMGGHALDRFHYAEEAMLSMAIEIIEEELIEPLESVAITQHWFDRYYQP